MISVGLGLTSVALRPRQRAVNFDMTSAVLPAGLAFTRASTATYLAAGPILTTAAVDAPRFEPDPTTGLPGLLMEPYRVNLMSRSAIASGVWIVSGATLTDLSLGALGFFDGASVVSNGANWHRAYRNLPLTGGVTYTISLMLQPGASNLLLVQFKNDTTSASTSINGAFGSLDVASTSAGAATLVEDTLLADATTRRLIIQFTPDADASFGIGLGPYSVVASEDVTLLSCQVEDGLSATSYIPTNGNTEVREADELTTSDLTGLYDMQVTYTDGAVLTTSAVSVVPGTALPIAPGRVASLMFLPAG